MTDRDVRADLLVEIGTEELPPVALKDLSEAFRSAFARELEQRAIERGEVECFATPRRLALLVRDLATRQADRETLRRGPALAAAYGPDGSPTQAALGFARSCGVPVESLDRERSDKGEWLCHRARVPGASVAELVPGIAEAALAALPIPKRMRWGTGDAEFVRPVHWVCLVLGSTPLAGRVLGVEAQGRTRGHRFHCPQAIPIGRADDYARILREEGRVEPSFESRRDLIRQQIEAIARDWSLRPQIDPELLDEVTALVEWPSALLGTFDESFLAVPAEVLVETMQKNQKYFPIKCPDGSLDARFIAVANIESKDPTQVKAGNERVIRPRFADAKFFWEQDLARPLEGFFGALERVVFQERLGSVADKSRRVEALAGALAERLGAPVDKVQRAARLGKCDLASSMVYELPALQGTMGRYYASRSGEDPCVCAAMEEQYLPRFAGDRLPETACGMLVGVADRLDTLVGIFGIGQRPSGAKDPYGLRRASIAVLRIAIEGPLDLDLLWALETAERGYPVGTLEPGVAAGVLAYMLDRLTGYYQDRGIGSDTVEAVLATGETVPSLIDQRIRAVSAFRRLPEAEALAAATKRIRNILAKAQVDLGEEATPSADLFEVPGESVLWDRLKALSAQVEPLLAERSYAAVLEALAGLRGDVDRFFEEALVMAEDPAVRRNRLALLAALLRAFLNVADISRLQSGH